MPATNAIAEALNAIIMTLDPLQRWQAAGRFNGSWITQKWFITISLITIIILITIILIVSLIRSLQKSKTKKLIAARLSQIKGLSPNEIQTIKDITSNPKLKNKTEIFTNKKVFDEGAKKIIEKQKKQKSPEQIQKLKEELNLLGQKLGFQVTEPVPNIAANRQLSTKQIPTGKTLYVSATTSKAGEIESIVTENNENGLTVKLTTHPRINFNEKWRGLYSFEELVCGFETSVISYDGSCLVLAHSEDIQCFNRRRFVRVPAEHQALIALFPQNKTTEDKNAENKTDTNAIENQQQNPPALCPPEFINAIVTDMGGPGLKLKTDLKAQVGDRILVILDLTEPNKKIVQDIAVVRRTMQNQDDNFLAAEMFGLSDEHVEELVHATNTAPTEAKTAATDTSTTPTDADTAPTDANTTPTDENTTPADANAAPTEIKTAPADTNTAPTDTSATPTETNTTPTDTSTTPAATNAAATDEKATPADTNTATTDTSTTPTDANTAPTDTNTATTDTSATPTEANAAPTDISTAPADELQEKNNNENNTNKNEENQKENITQEA